jgi:hypothetical protein
VRGQRAPTFCAAWTCSKRTPPAARRSDPRRLDGRASVTPERVPPAQGVDRDQQDVEAGLAADGAGRPRPATAGGDGGEARPAMPRARAGRRAAARARAAGRRVAPLRFALSADPVGAPTRAAHINTPHSRDATDTRVPCGPPPLHGTPGRLRVRGRPTPSTHAPPDVGPARHRRQHAARGPRRQLRVALRAHRRPWTALARRRALRARLYAGPRHPARAHLDPDRPRATRARRARPTARSRWGRGRRPSPRRCAREAWPPAPHLRIPPGPALRPRARVRYLRRTRWGSPRA